MTPSTMRIAALLGMIMLGIIASPCLGQQANSFETEKNSAYQLFQHGKVREAITSLQGLIGSAPNLVTRLKMQRDILELCTTAYDLQCVSNTIQDMLPPIAQDRNLSFLYPEIVLYEIKANIWAQNDAYIEQTLARGGASSVANIASNPSTYAEVQLALNTYYIRKNDLISAEQSISSAILGLLLGDANASYTNSKILVRLIGALISAQDIVGAFELVRAVDSYIVNSIRRDSPLNAEYKAHVGRLLAFTNLHSATVSTLTDAASLIDALQINDEIKAYDTGAANSLTSATLVLDGKLEQAIAVHSKHPMQKNRNAIIQRGKFDTVTELYFAVSDVLLSSRSNNQPDQRWKELFEIEPPWKMDEVLSAHINSYRHFALGLLSFGNSKAEEGAKFVILAAKQRTDNFEKVMRANFEGFQLPNSVDRILVTAGLTSAAKLGGQENINLMLRGGEFLSRSLRDSLGDVAVLLGSQSDAKSRKDAQSYIHLLRQKRDWELDKIKKFLAKDAVTLQNKGALVNEYSDAVTKLGNLKGRLRSGGQLEQSKGLPTLNDIQQALSEHDAFITYHPQVGGIGKICIRRESAIYALAPYELPITSGHVRLIQLATSADHPPSLELDKQFPVASAIYLRNYLFAGLEACLSPGTHVIVSLPNEFAGVPLGALLADSPPPDGEGYDLRKAQWLIKEMSFSIVSSARQFVATVPLSKRPIAAHRFLGIGDPSLDKDHLAKIALTSAYRGSLKTPNGLSDFMELPETADELRTVARIFGAEQSDVLLQERATEESFRVKPLTEYEVIHFASHGLIKAELPGLTESALILTPSNSEDPFNDGLLSASEISRLSLNARLIVLSACNTAKYDLAQAGLGIQDFQTAFTIAGAPTVLAALWSIDSFTARDLVIGFFKVWRSEDSLSAAESLAVATRKYLNQADIAHQHPRFWAAFQVAGYGGIRGTRSATSEIPPDEFSPVSGYASGGEIVSVGHIGSDAVMSTIGDWNGKKMASIISRRNADNTVKWAISSHEFGAGNILTQGEIIYALGYASEQHPIPVIRSFAADGRLRWTVRFDELADYTFSDLEWTSHGLMVIAYPQLRSGESTDAFVLKLDDQGAIRQRVAIKVDKSGLLIGKYAFVKNWEHRIAVAINVGGTPRMNLDRKNVFGLPSHCWENASATLLEFDPIDLRLLASRSIANFKVGSLIAAGEDLLLGGEAFDNCALHGVAAVYHYPSIGAGRFLWRESDLFWSNVAGIKLIDDQIVAAVDYQLTLGIGIQPSGLSDSYDKRWGDRNTATMESSLIFFDRKGFVLKSLNYSAGLAIFVQGLEVIGQKPMLYGSLGGMPAITRH